MTRSESSKGSVNGSTSGSIKHTTVGFVNHDPTQQRAPSYAFGIRYDCEKTQPYPGPKYMVRGGQTARGNGQGPSYSMTGRPKNMFDIMAQNSSPGPSAYMVPSVAHTSLERKAPRYSFGLPYERNCKTHAPAPNTYYLPSTLGARVPHLRGAPASTLHGKGSHNKGFSFDHAKTPGPARYGAVDPSLTAPRAPVITLKSRPKLPPIKLVTPGPGAYDQSKGSSVCKSSPRFSMGVRHGENVRPLFTLADVSD